LFYLVSSTLAVSAFFLLSELSERGRAEGAAAMEVAGDEEEEEEEEEVIGVAIPATMAILGISFVCCALLLAGLPPLSGFVAKFVLLRALFPPAEPSASVAVDAMSWTLLSVLLLSGLAVTIGLMRAGVRALWVPSGGSIPTVRAVEIAPVAVLLLLGLALTVQAGPASRFVNATAQSLHAPQDYIRDVLAAPRANRASGGSGS